MALNLRSDVTVIVWSQSKFKVWLGRTSDGSSATCPKSSSYFLTLTTVKSCLKGE